MQSGESGSRSTGQPEPRVENAVRPLPEEYILAQTESVRSEVLYKMQLVHRVGLGVVTAPVVVLPILARLQDYLPAIAGNDAPVGTADTTLNIVLLLVSIGIPFLLLWAEFFCVSQTNGILRAGHWLRHIEECMGIAAPEKSMCAWESWINSKELRDLDYPIASTMRLALITLYYFAAAILVGFMISERLWLAEETTTKINSIMVLYTIILFYTALFAIFLILRRRHTTTIGNECR